ncbi:MAG: DUF4129 domain-containing protein [Arenicella sp.]
MQLDNLQIDPRLRHKWAAVDLGCRLGAIWWWPLFLSWFLVSLPFAVGACFLSIEYPWLGFLFIWWFKPLFDKLPLYIASRKVFSQSVSVGEALKTTLKLWKHDGFWWLTFRRLSFTRSFDMPVSVLEHLSGKRRRQRLNVLHAKASSAPTMLTFVCVHIESFLAVGLVFLVGMFLPEQYSLFNYLVENEGGAIWVQTLVYYFCMCVIAPFYVTAGFIAYLNRRVELEGWDIEIQFRKLSAEKKTSKNTHKTGLLSAIVCSVLILGLSGVVGNNSVQAKGESEIVVQYEDDRPDQSEAKRLISQIVQGKDFGGEKEVESWQFKDIKDKKKRDAIPEWIINIVEFFEKHANTLGTVGQLVKWIFWTLAVLLLAYLLFYFRKNIAGIIRSFGKKPDLVKKPEVLFGLDVRAESLPDDVIESTWHLWNSGQNREAVSLLYRASLSRLLHQFGCQFYDGYTENECLQQVSLLANDELHRYMQTLTSAWQSLAYGHIPLEEEVFIQLCDDWQRVLTAEVDNENV